MDKTEERGTNYPEDLGREVVFQKEVNFELLPNEQNLAKQGKGW